MSKFSKSTRSNQFSAGALALLFAVTTVQAQQPSPASSTQPVTGYVRFWNMLAGKAAPTLQLLSAEDKLLTTAPPNNSGSNYVGIPPGSYTFIVRKPGDAVNPLKKLPVILRGNTYITFLAQEKNGQPTVDLIDDTLDPKKADGPSRLVVRQFIPSARVIVSTREGVASQEVGFGETATLENLPNRVLFLTMKAVGLGPELKMWNTEADFTAARHATLLIINDSYGRFRPRLSYDGQAGSIPDPTPTPSPKP